jgi:hypothetical protein
VFRTFDDARAGDDRKSAVSKRGFAY